MTVDIEKMKALALAATPGSWHWIESMDGDKMAELRSRSNALICDFGCDGKVSVEGTEPDAADMQFIAECDPAAVLELIAEVERLRAEAERYRWLRDKSEPGICAFYLSVGQAFMGVKFARETVDEAIDAAIGAHTKAGKEPG
jgi:hypothetical protein